MLNTWHQAQVPHSPKRSVFKSSTSRYLKLSRHFCSSLDWRTTFATMSRIWLRWFNPFESWWTWRSTKDPRNWHGERNLYKHFTSVVSLCLIVRNYIFWKTLLFRYYRLMHQVRVIRFFSKSLVGSQLNWSAREKECYGIYYGVKLFEDLLDNRYFIMKTDLMNLSYINVTFTGKGLRWKLYLPDKDFDLYHVSGKEEHQFVPVMC
jgi:hypothetical protein